MSKSKLKTEIIVRMTELDVRNQNIRSWYELGGLSRFLDLYETTGTLEKHNIALHSQPVMNSISTFTGLWAVDKESMEMIFTDEDDGTDEPEVRMPITCQIEHLETGEVIYHSLMSSSYLFRENEDGSVTGLFVD